MTQLHRSEIETHLSSSFQRSYDPRLAWSSAASAVLGLPGLRAGYLFSQTDGSGDMLDISGNGKTLTRNGNAEYLVENLYTCGDLDGTGDYWNIADDAVFNIEGRESYMGTNAGLSVGAWIYSNNRPAVAGEHVLGKWDAGGGQTAYNLAIDGGVNALFSVKIGATTATATSATTITSQTWTFVAGVYGQGGLPAVYVNGSKTIAGAGGSWLNTCTADFCIGAADNGTANYFDGKIALAFVCASKIADAHVTAFYHQTRALFGQ